MISHDLIRKYKKDIVYSSIGAISGFIIFILIRLIILYCVGAPKDAPPNIYNRIYYLLFSKLSELAFKISGESLLVAHCVFWINIMFFMLICGCILVIIRRKFFDNQKELAKGLPQPSI